MPKRLLTLQVGAAFAGLEEELIHRPAEPVWMLQGEDSR